MCSTEVGLNKQRLLAEQGVSLPAPVLNTVLFPKPELALLGRAGSYLLAGASANGLGMEAQAAAAV